MTAGDDKELVAAEHSFSRSVRGWGTMYSLGATILRFLSPIWSCRHSFLSCVQPQG